jgi:hypothetical protein
MTLAGPRKKDPVLTLRRVFVHSTARAQAAVTARERKLDQARDDLERRPRHPTGHRRPQRPRQPLGMGPPGTQTQEATTPFYLPPLRNAALAAEAALDGWHALLTNLDPAHADAPEVLRRYKGQETVERRYSAFKGPLAVASMFLKNNRRIAALITVICPSTADLLPDRTPDTAGDRPTDHTRRALRRAPGQTHRPADLRGSGPAPAHPRHPTRTSRHSTTTTTTSQTPCPARG